MKIDRLMLYALVGGAILGGVVYMKMCHHKEVEDFHIHVVAEGIQGLDSNLEISTDANCALLKMEIRSLLASFNSYDSATSMNSKVKKIEEIKHRLAVIKSGFPQRNLEVGDVENRQDATPCSDGTTRRSIPGTAYSSALDLFTEKLSCFLEEDGRDESLKELQVSYTQLNSIRGDFIAKADEIIAVIDGILGRDSGEPFQETAMYDPAQFEADKKKYMEQFGILQMRYLTTINKLAADLASKSNQLVVTLGTEKQWWQLAGLIYMLGIFLGSYGFIRSLVAITEKAIVSREEGEEYTVGRGWFGLITDLEIEMKSIFDRKEVADRKISDLNSKKAIEESAIENLAHDINNLLQVALANTELLEKKTSGTDPRVVHNDSIRSSLEEIGMKLRDLKSGLGEEAQVVHLPSRLDTLTKSLESEEAKIVVNYKEEDSRVLCIETDLDRILQNLMLNAIEANKRSGGKSVKVNLRRANRPEDREILESGSNRLSPDVDYLVIEVSDQGDGVDQKLGKDVFLLGVSTKFGDQVQDEKEKGRSIGRGLHIVWSKVKSNGGYVDFEPNVRRGTTFSVFLPLVNPNEVGEIKDSSGEFIAMDVTGKKLVLVEDLPDLRETLDQVLTHQFNYEVTSFGEARIALDYIKEHSPDVIVTDIDLGNLMMTGLEMTRKLREDGVKTPILVMTGKNNITVTEIDIPSDGVVKLLRKPFETDELNEEIQRLLFDDDDDYEYEGALLQVS